MIEPPIGEAMGIRVLDCAPMSPWFPRWHVGGTCLLVDTDQGPYLWIRAWVSMTSRTRRDGFVSSRASSGFTGILRARPSGRWRAWCYSPEAVGHIVMTHLHFDHAGGLPDFPGAHVHVHRREVEAMRRPRTLDRPGL